VCIPTCAAPLPQALPPPGPHLAPQHRTRPPFDSRQNTNSLSAANKLSIRCAWAGTSAFTSAYGSSWAPGSCTTPLPLSPSPPPPSPSPPPPPTSPTQACTHTFTSKGSLTNAVTEFNSNAALAIANYGAIADWCVSAITDMSWLFYDSQNFNADISSWDTSSVTTMSHMFHVRYARALAPKS